MSRQNADLPQTIRLDRRRFLVAAGALVAAGMVPSRVLALAGPFTLKQGAFDLTVVSDGDLELPIAVFGTNAPPEELKKLFAAAGVTGDKAPTAVNPVVARSGGDLILFDTGGKIAPTNGQLVESLKAAGIDPASITKVVMTHAHPDHIWGVAKDGALNFPNATHHVAAAEWDFWSAGDLASRMPKEMGEMIAGIQASLKAIESKLVRFKPGDDVVGGVRALDTAGHTPGHVSFEIAGGDGLVIMGDVANSVVSGFAHPEWHFGFDADKDKASAVRKAMLERSASDKVRMIGYHWPYPCIGVAERDGTSYRYAPAA